MSNNNHKSRFASAFVKGLNASSLESAARQERYEKIYEIERTKWPFGWGSMMRSEIPKELHGKLDECISVSQNVAREACQTVELTEKYIQNNL